MSLKIFSEIQKSKTITKLNFQLYKRKDNIKAKKLSDFNKRPALLLPLIAVFLIAGLFSANFIKANNLPVVQKSGTLQENETWTAGNVYMVNGMVTVPDTLSLTIEPGAIVKFVNYYQAVIRVATGGTLNVTGDSSNSVVFTSYKDDSVGGDSNGDGSSSGSHGDYNRAIESNGGTVNIAHAEFKYGVGAITATNSEIEANNISVQDSNTAVSLAGGKANFGDTSISNSAYGIKVSGTAEVAYRGSFNNISTKAIQSCNWGGSCSVDAAYVDWGSADGPSPSSGSLVCGAVWVNPWVHNGSQYNGGLFGSTNCNGSPTPETNLNNSISSFQQRVNTKQIDCSNGFQDACDAIDNAMACLGGARSVAAGQVAFEVPPVSSSQDIDDFSGLMAYNASAHVASLVPIQPTSLGHILSITGAVQSIISMASAYSSCAP